MIEPIPFKVGEKYTIYRMTALAAVLRKEIIVTSLHSEPAFYKRTTYENPSLEGKWVFGSHTEGNKLKQYLFQLRPAQDLVIPGHGHILTESEAYTQFSGNACINLAGSVNQVKELVEQNINPNFTKHDLIIAINQKGSEGELVYPDHPTDHVIVRKMRLK